MIGKLFKLTRATKIALQPILVNVTVENVFEQSVDFIITCNKDKSRVNLRKHDTLALTINPVLMK